MRTGDFQPVRVLLTYQRWLYLFVGSCIGGTFFYLAARNIDLDKALVLIYNINAAWLLPFTVCWLVVLFLRGMRWRIMFPDNTRPSLRHALDGVIIGKVANNLIPARLGEFVRASIVGRLYPQVGLTGCFATIVIEKTFDVLAILAMLGIALFFAPLPDWIVNAGMWLVLVFSLLLLVLWGIGRVELSELAKPAHSANYVSRIKSTFYVVTQKFSFGLHSLRSLQHFSPCAFLTLLIWGFETFTFFLLMQAFSIDAPYMAAVIALLFLCIGAMIPSAPGFIGTYQLFIVAGMQIYGVPETQAFAFSLLLNLYVLVVPFLLAFVIVIMDDGVINFRQIFDSASKER